MELTRKVVVDEAMWYRGKGDLESRLRRHQDGLMCCLGFACVQEGATEEAITGLSFSDGLCDLPEYLRAYDWLRAVGRLNDSQTLKDEDRKVKLIEKFKEQGVELTFVNSGAQDAL